jgi:hypothetical protein
MNRSAVRFPADGGRDILNRFSAYGAGRLRPFRTFRGLRPARPAPAASSSIPVFRSCTHTHSHCD